MSWCDGKQCTVTAVKDFNADGSNEQVYWHSCLAIDIHGKALNGKFYFVFILGSFVDLISSQVSRILRFSIAMYLSDINWMPMGDGEILVDSKRILLGVMRNRSAHSNSTLFAFFDLTLPIRQDLMRTMSLRKPIAFVGGYRSMTLASSSWQFRP